MQTDICKWLDRLNYQTGSEKINNVRITTLELLGRHYPGMLKASPNQTLTQEESSSFCLALAEKVSTHDFLQSLSIFIDLLYFGRDNLDWEVFIPSFPALTRRERNRFIAGEFAVDQANAAARLLLDDLVNPIPATLLQRYGQILLSAVLFGGLASPGEHYRFLSALTDMSHFTTSTLVVPLEKRLWFADPITQGLLLRWHKTHQMDQQFVAEALYTDRAIRSYLDSHNFSFSISVAALRKQCTQWLSLRLPPVLVDYASGKNISYSLPQPTWHRLYSGQALAITNQENTAEETLPKADEIYSSHPSVIDLRGQITLFKDLTKKSGKVGNKHADYRQVLEDFLRENKNALSPALYYLICWGIELVTYISPEELTYYQGRDKHKLRPGSARTYLGHIARFLLTEASGEDLAELESEELHDLYARTIQLAPTGKEDNHGKNAATRCAETLYRFHAFLQKRHGAAWVDFSDLVAQVSLSATVDANLISVVEYQRVLQVLGSELTRPTDLQMMQILVTILGWELGLRRGECLRLQLCDLQFCQDDAILLVRNNSYGQTKSLSSIRKLPLTVLLSSESLQRLENWHKKRYLEIGSKNISAPLFCQSDNLSPIQPDILFGPIRSALHQVTGDYSLRFHHLRHSFANWTFLRLMRYTCPELKAPFLDDVRFNLNSCDLLRQGLLKNNISGRKTLYELARLLGHESPQTTLQSYVHLCDWLLAQSHCEPVLNVEKIASLTGLSIDQVYYLDKKSSQNHQGREWRLSSYLKHLPSIPQKKEYPMVAPNLTILSSKQDFNREKFNKLQRQIPRALEALSKGEDSAIAARSLCIGEDTIRRWLDNANWIRSLQTKRKVPRHLNVSQVKKGIEYFPLPLNRAHEKSLYHRIFRAVVAQDEQEHGKLKKFLHYFLTQFSIASKGIPFASEQHLDLYCTRLRDLGIFKNEICLISELRQASRPEVLQEEMRLKNSYKNAATFAATSYQGKKDKKYPLTLRVIHPEDSRNDPDNGQYRSNYGFRYAIYILAIALFEESDR